MSEVRWTGAGAIAALVLAAGSEPAASQELQNRAITGNATVNRGRFMINQPVGTFEIGGGPLSGDEAADVLVHADGFADLPSGFRLTSASDFIFNASDQTHTLTLWRTQPGQFSYTGPAAIQLDGSYLYTNLAGETKADFGGAVGPDGNRVNPLMSAERVPGADLNLAGVQFRSSGIGLTDRRLTASEIPALRVMQWGTGTDYLQYDATVTITTEGSDTERTRLRLRPTLSDWGTEELKARIDSDVLFDSADDTASVAVSSRFMPDHSSLGRKTFTTDLGTFIQPVESLAGQDVQTSLPISFSYHVLADNEVVGEDVTVYYYSLPGNPDPYIGQTFRNPSLGRRYGTDTHTAITVRDTFTAGALPGPVTLTEANGDIVGEGLAGENVQASFEYQYRAQQVERAIVTTWDLPGDADFELINFESTSSFGRPQASAELSVRLLGSTVEDFLLGPVDGASAEPYVTTLAPGESLAWNAAYKEGTITPGSWGWGWHAHVEVTIRDRYEPTDNAAVHETEGLVYGSSFERKFVTPVSAIVYAPPSDAVTGDVSAGTDLAERQLIATSTRDTTVSLIDSETLSAATTVSASFAAAGVMELGAGIRGDVVSLEGLDGVLHVLEIGFDAELGTATELLWFSEDHGAWINAVLGNSNIANLDLDAGTLTVDGVGTTIAAYLASMRFEGAYADYLAGQLGTPELGAFGVDAVRNVVWAVIDHNSDFGAAVPEPASVAWLVAGVALLIRRRGAD